MFFTTTQVRDPLTVLQSRKERTNATEELWRVGRDYLLEWTRERTHALHELGIEVKIYKINGINNRCVFIREEAPDPHYSVAVYTQRETHLLVRLTRHRKGYVDSSDDYEVRVNLRKPQKTTTKFIHTINNTLENMLRKI